MSGITSDRAQGTEVPVDDDVRAEVRGRDLQDLDEARRLITALAGLVTAAAPEIGNQHARSLRDGLRSLQLAFREASPFPDAPGEPGSVDDALMTVDIFLN